CTPPVKYYIEHVLYLALRDHVLMRDFALYADGARIVQSLTASHLARPALVAMAKRAGPPHPPEVALSDDNRIGQCWLSARKGGQLGVVLPELVRPSHVTIDHIPVEIAATPGQAPRDMRLWGVVDGEANHAFFRSLMQSAPTVAMPNAGPRVSSGHLFVQLATIEYDLHAPSHVQTFEVEPAVIGSGMYFGVIVLELVDNWGGGTTCLYRVRIHGEKAMI
ncbi:hypothetical protein BD414DRAFT_428486, partial [Trametes punicea]